MIVVDASVAVKWFLKEDYSDNAITLLTLEHKLVGPTLAIYEVTSALVRAFRRDDIDIELATACRDRWLHTVKTNVLRLELDHRDLIRGSEIASTIKHSFADCVYLAMAERFDVPLVTADTVFFEKVRHEFGRVCLISNVLDIQPDMSTK